MSLQDFAIVISFFYIFLLDISWIGKCISRLLLATFFALILMLQSTYVSMDNFHSIINILKVFNCFVFFPLVVMYLFENKQSIEIAKRSLIISCLVSSIIFMATNPISLNQRLCSYSGDPVMYAFLLGFVFIIVLFSDKRTFGRLNVFRPLILAFVGLQILLTGSGSGIIILLIATTVKVTFVDGSFNFGSFVGKVILSVIGFSAVWLSPISSLTKARINEIINPTTHYNLTAGSGQSTLEARSLSVKYAWKAIQESPILGHGFFSGDQVTEIGLQPHNFIVLCWLTGGLAGLILSIVLISQSVLSLKKSLFSTMQLNFSIILATWFALFSASIFWDTAFFSSLYIAIYGPKNLRPKITGKVS